MAQRQELEILLRARNETAAAFKGLSQGLRQVQADAKAVGTTFRQQQSAFDGFTNAQLRAFAGMSSVATQSKALWAALAAAPAVVAAGIAGVTAAVYHLGQRGSEIKGVKDSFDQLTKAVGGSSQFLQQARTATKGLLTDYDLMLNANRLLAARVPLTGEKFGELSRMAIALGRSVGKDAKESVDRLAQGLAKLEPELLDEINLKVSATDATKKYAAQIGVAAKDLTAYQRQIAFVNEITEQMKQRTAELGDVQLTFRDRITIATNAVLNFRDNLALAVAVAPGLGRGMDIVSAAILNAFGGDQQRAIQTLASWVDKFAIGVVRAGEVAVTSAKVAMQAWSGFQVFFAGLAQGITGVLGAIVGAQAKVFEFLSFANPALSGFYSKAAEGARGLAKELNLSSQAWGLAGKMAHDTGFRWYTAIAQVETQIGNLRREMEEASTKGVTAAAIQKAVAAATTEHGKAAGLSAKEIAKAKKEHEAFLRVIDKQNDALGISNQELKWASVMWKQFHAALMPVGMATLPKIVTDTYELAAGLRGVGVQMQFVSSKSHDMGKAVDDAIDDAEEKARKLKDALDEIGEQNARAIVGTFDAIARSIGGSFDRIASGWIGMFDQMISASKQKGGALWKFMQSPAGQKVGGGLQVGFETFSQGYQFGQGMGPGKGAIAGGASGFATGAMIGTYVMPGLGTLAGGLIGMGAGAIGGWLGGKKKEKEEKAALKELQADLLKTYGGMDRLRKLAQSVGVDIEKAFSSKKPKDALAVINQFSEALDRQKAKIEGINTATEGLNIRSAAAFGGNLPELIDQRVELEKGVAELKKAIAEADAGGDRAGADRLRQQLAAAQAELDKVQGKLVTIGATGEAEFTRLGVYAAATFAAHVKETGNVVTALSAIEPTLAQLQTAQEAFGFAGSEALNKLLGFRDVVNTNQDVFNSLAGLTQMMQGFGDAGLMTRDLFQTFAQDAGAQLQTLIGRGVDANQALALMAPTLQQLYEGQSKYGAITDEATAALIEQAKQQGLVGDHMKSTNEQILDAVIDVKDAVKELAATLRGEVPAAAATAAQGIQNQFNGLNIRVPVHYVPTGDDPRHHKMPEPYEGQGGGGEYQGYATGGVVPFTPGGRLIRVAERGTEHVVTEEQKRAMQAAPTVNLSFNISGEAARDGAVLRDTIRREVVPEIVRAISANQGGARTHMRQALGVRG